MEMLIYSLALTSLSDHFGQPGRFPDRDLELLYRFRRGNDRKRRGKSRSDIVERAPDSSFAS